MTYLACSWTHSQHHLLRIYQPLCAWRQATGRIGRANETEWDFIDKSGREVDGLVSCKQCSSGAPSLTIVTLDLHHKCQPELAQMGLDVVYCNSRRWSDRSGWKGMYPIHTVQPFVSSHFVGNGSCTCPPTRTAMCVNISHRVIPSLSNHGCYIYT